jgi:hypothetical protein
MGTLGKQNAIKHGGDGAIKRLSDSQPFLGVAHETELTVTGELEREGLINVYKKRAIRLQTVADLFYQAILGATTLEKLDSLVQRYGWLQNSALRALLVIQDLERHSKKFDASYIQVNDNGTDKTTD